MLKPSGWRRQICVRRKSVLVRPAGFRQGLITLAIETSCDDTSVAILESHIDRVSFKETDEFPQGNQAILHFHEKITSDNNRFGGIHPLVSLASHQRCLGKLIERALSRLPKVPKESPSHRGTLSVLSASTCITVQKPDFVSVTRGPGMRSCLSAGIDTAKGLAVAWQIPLVAVNHMQAHALTPRLVSALSRSTDQPAKTEPTFPFLSLLVSGGHTLLIYSKGLTDHSVLATTTDIAIGDAIDKIAKHVLPSDLIIHSQDTMYGRMLEEFAFPRGFMDHKYNPPVTRASELARKISPWGWDLVPPLAETRSGSKNRSMEFSFSGLETACRRIMERRCAEGENPREREDCMGHEERQFLAREAMRTAFEHLAGRVVLALQAMDLETKTTSKHSRQSNSDSPDPKAISTLVVSGGVAANAYLKTILRSFLDKRGYGHIGLVFPPAELCTDNAAMIAWTGMEMFAQGWQSDLAVRALRKWSLDSDGESEGEEGASGVLGVGGWILREGFNEKEGERENPLIS